MKAILKNIKKPRPLNLFRLNSKNFSTHFQKEFKCFSNTVYTQTSYTQIQKKNFYKIRKYNFSEKSPNDDGKKENKDEEKSPYKQEITKQLIHMNLWILLSFGVTVLYILKHNNEKEVTFEDFARYVQQKKIMDIEIKKGMDVFYYVFAQTNENTRVKVKILDNESFIRTLEKIQIEMVIL